MKNAIVTGGTLDLVLLRCFSVKGITYIQHMLDVI